MAKIKFVLFSLILLTITKPAIAEFFSTGENQEVFDPVALYLTWQNDPATTMTIDWHTTQGQRPSVIQYKKTGSHDWQEATGDQWLFPYSENRIIHRVELTGLEANSTYRFRFGEDSKSYKFRTMPLSAEQPVRFAAGGDVRHTKEWMEQTNKHVLAYDPDFIIWGGDLAYADAREDRLYRWEEFFDAMKNTLITTDGRVIPVLVTIGNHEVLGGYLHREDRREDLDLPPYLENNESRELLAPYFYSLFASPGQPGYNVIDFGDYMSVILLDSGHSNPVTGQQKQWLEQTLYERQHIPHLFPVYHVPAYPSVRSFYNSLITEVRENWVPLFESYGVRTAFENHDHAYKRTYPIRNGAIDETGIVYIGDGAWGVRTREVGRSHNELAWYLKQGASERHFIIGTIQGTHQHFLTVNEDGYIIDEFPRTPLTNVKYTYDPEAVFLTWQQDPTTTMTIDWHTLGDDNRPFLEYKQVGSVTWQRAEGEDRPFPFSDRTINRVELSGLEPGTSYRIRFGFDSKQYKFRTMPEYGNRPIRFVAGGDIMASTEQMKQTSAVAAQYEPDFAVFGGDLAYANSDPRRTERWYSYFEILKTTFTGEGNRLIPVINAIGNHEVWRVGRLQRDNLPEDFGETEWGIEQNDAVFFSELFAFPGQPEYNVLDFGDYMSFVILDSDHRNDVEGIQTEWLKNVLNERKNVPHIFPVYHVPAYPSARRYATGTSVRIRENWIPLFDSSTGVRVVFENHDHTYKRTYPLTGNQMDPNGIVYIGDGAWGVNTREIGANHTTEDEGWYLKRAESRRHFILGTISGPQQHFLMVDEDGIIFDQYPEAPHIEIQTPAGFEAENPAAY